MLKKHIIRYIFRYNKWLYGAICALIFIMSVLFFSLVLMNSSYESLQKQYKQHQQQEDFQFLPNVGPVASVTEEILKLEQKYNFKSEAQAFKILETDNLSYKIIKQALHINKPLFIAGDLAKKDNEIVVDIKSANRLKLAVGDQITVLEQAYTISGIASFPSQIQPNMSLTGFRMYNDQQAMLVSFTDFVYDKLIYDEKLVYAAVWLGEPQKLDINQFAYLNVFKDNGEINALVNKLTMNQMIAGLSTGVLSSIVFIMILMLLYKMVKDNETYFGILRGIGYSTLYIIRSVSPLLITFVFPIIVGYLVSVLLQQPLFLFMNQEIVTPYYKAAHSWLIALIASGIFILIVSLLSIIHLTVLLKKSPITMIHGLTNSKMSRFRQLVLNLFNKMKGIRKLQLKFIFSHVFVLILTLFTGFALGVQMLLSFSLYEFPTALVAGIKDQFNYKYNVKFLSPIQIIEDDNNVYYNMKTSTLKLDDESSNVDIIIVNQPAKQNLLQLQLYNDGANINGLMNHGIIISKWLANKYNLSIGDTINLTIGHDLYEFAISGIHQGLQGGEVYTSKQYFEKLTNDRLLLVDGMYTNNDNWHISVNTTVNSVVNQHEIIKSAEKSVEQYKIMSVFLLAVGIIICVILFTIALYIVMQNGQKHILLLKALGYTNKQVYTITIEGYLIVLLLGLVAARPYLSLLTIYLFDMLSKVSSFYLPINSRVIHITYLVIILILFFNAVSQIYMRKISNTKNYSSLMNE